jgi:hypothetical protein
MVARQLHEALTSPRSDHRIIAAVRVLHKVSVFVCAA